MLWQIQPVREAGQLSQRLHGGFQHFDIQDPIDAVIDELIVRVIAADQIIAAIHCYHLVGIDDVFLDLAFRVKAWMQLAINIIRTVVEPNLFFPAYGLVKDIDTVEKM